MKSLNYAHTGKERLLKPSKRSNNSNYLHVVFCVDNIRKHQSVHRLVAEAFIPNPDNKPTVNHKDENPLNNNVTNLEWATTKEQNCHGTRLKRIAEKQSKPVKCIETRYNL